MRYHCLPTVGAIACFVAMTAARADAQLIELQPGARVRVRAPEVVAGRLEAVVIARSGDTVTLTTPRGAPIPVPLGAITAAEVSRGRSRSDGAVKGLKLGTGIGLAMGLLSAIGYDAGSDACGSEPCENDLTPGELVAASLITGATLGAGIGAMVGAEHWERLTIPARVVVRRDRDRLTLALAISF
jgi:hypothetical protein